MTPTLTVGSAPGGRRRRPGSSRCMRSIRRAICTVAFTHGSRSERLECICVPRTRTLKSAAPRETVSIASHSETIPQGSPSTAASPASRPDSASHWLPRREPASSSAVSTSVHRAAFEPVLLERREREDHRRDGALHVARPDAVQLAVLDGRAVRVARSTRRGRPAAWCRGARPGSGSRPLRPRARAGSAAPPARRRSRSVRRRGRAASARRAPPRRARRRAGSGSASRPARARTRPARRAARAGTRRATVGVGRHAANVSIARAILAIPSTSTSSSTPNEMRTRSSQPGPNTSPGRDRDVRARRAAAA